MAESTQNERGGQAIEPKEKRGRPDFVAGLVIALPLLALVIVVFVSLQAWYALGFVGLVVLLVLYAWLRERRRFQFQDVEKWIGLLLASFVFIVSIAALWENYKQRDVAADFTRVGGATRVETAELASLFWHASLGSSPSNARYVSVPQGASAGDTWEAALCAASIGVPLLFVPGPSRPEAMRPYKRYVSSLGTAVRGGGSCPPSPIPVQFWEQLSVFTPSKGFFPTPVLNKVNPSNSLAPTVVFAVPLATVPPRNVTEASSDPDVAVAFVLAAHLAQQRLAQQGSNPVGRVSLVVIPRYVEADGSLEEALRQQKKPVRSGLVIGGDAISPQAPLLRQLITARDRSGLLGALSTSLDSLGGVATALFALFALAGAAAAATTVVPRVEVAVGRLRGRSPGPEWRGKMGPSLSFGEMTLFGKRTQLGMSNGRVVTGEIGGLVSLGSGRIGVQVAGDGAPPSESEKGEKSAPTRSSHEREEDADWIFGDRISEGRDREPEEGRPELVIPIDRIVTAERLSGAASEGGRRVSGSSDGVPAGKMLRWRRRSWFWGLKERVNTPKVRLSLTSRQTVVGTFVAEEEFAPSRVGIRLTEATISKEIEATRSSFPAADADEGIVVVDQIVYMTLAPRTFV